MGMLTPQWRKSTRSGGNGGSCVEVADNLPTVVLVRDTKDRDGGTLRIARGIEVGLCGDMASDPAHLSTLLDLGLRRVSVPPARPATVKAAIAAWPSRQIILRVESTKRSSWRLQKSCRPSKF